MRLRAAIVGPSRPWEELLTQEGFPWDVVDVRRTPLAGEYSVAIVHRSLDPEEREVLAAYMRSGGAVLGDAAHSTGFCSTSARADYLEYVVGDGVFADVHLCALGMRGAISKEAAYGRTQTGFHAIFAGEMCGGLAVLLPFSVPLAMADERPAVTSFYARHERLPSERVSAVAKGEVRHLVRASLEFLHVERGLPYVHLWYYPEGSTNVFGFRVDTDGASRGETDELYRIAHNSGVRMSWFLDLRACEPRLEQFRAMVGQEIGLHCYEHREPAGEGALRADMEKGLRILQAAGFHPEGFAAPYGFWKPFVSSLPRALGLHYSSEFSFAYDTTPLAPTGLSGVHGVLQIPIHPICPGSLRRAGFSSSAMIDYYRYVVAQKRGRQEPLIFYHHPSHRMPEVIEMVCAEAKVSGTRTMTLGEYAAWWERRSPISLRMETEGDELRLDPADVLRCAEGDVAVRVARRGRKECIIPPAGRASLSLLPWRDRESVIAPEDIRRTRAFDLQRLLGTMHHTIIRRTR